MRKFWTKLGYLLKETWLGFKRGSWMNWAAISTVTVLLFLFGLSLQAGWQIDSLLNHFGSQMEIAIYLQPDIEGKDLIDQVKTIPEIETVNLIPKEQAWENLLEDLGVFYREEATEQLDGNPLVDEIKVRVNQIDLVPQIAEQLGQISGVSEVRYFNDALQKLQQIRDGLNWVSITLTGMLSLTAIAVITTTLRLIAIARQQEIQIMQLVGATKRWIYFPFMLQGVSFGLTGAAIAWGFITTLSQSFSNLLLQQSEFFKFLTDGFQLTIEQRLFLPIILLILGSLIGIIGSLFALRRFA
jgi:cell division transport system permease protein